MLCYITGASHYVSAAKLADIMDEPPVDFKLTKLAHRLSAGISRDIPYLKYGPERLPSDRTTRSGPSNVIPWKGVDQRDFGDVIVRLSEEFKLDESSRERYIAKRKRATKKKPKRKKQPAKRPPALDVSAIRKWVAKANKKVQEHARQRARERLGQF